MIAVCRQQQDPEFQAGSRQTEGKLVLQQALQAFPCCRPVPLPMLSAVNITGICHSHMQVLWGPAVHHNWPVPLPSDKHLHVAASLQLQCNTHRLEFPLPRPTVRYCRRLALCVHVHWSGKQDTLSYSSAALQLCFWMKVACQG